MHKTTLGLIMVRILALLAVSATLSAADPPSTRVRNAHLEMTVMTPDAKIGFYHGSRFDWSGVIRDVKYNTHTMFGKWKGTHNPANHDDITGPSEEFRIPLGYDAAKPGEIFLKLGVGTLVKPNDKPYNYATNYKIRHPGLWEITRGDDEICFAQGLLTDAGYGYKYTKTIDLLDSTAGFTIHHELKNVGTQRIVTDWYNHNFYNIDSDAIGPNYSVIFPFPITAPKPQERFAEVIALDGAALRFKSPLDKGSIYAELEGWGSDANHHAFSIHHQSSRVTMHVSGTEPVSKFLIWGMKETICPEPYIAIDLPPGETKSWTLTYKFTVGGTGRAIIR